MGTWPRGPSPAKVWVTPDQVVALRAAARETGVPYLRVRNDAMTQTMYDTGLRVGELVQLDVEFFRNEFRELYLPGHVQKSPSQGPPPSPVRMALADDTTQVLTEYLAERWKDPPALFPSRSSDRITTQGVRDMVRKVSVAADVRPYKVDGTRGDPTDLTPHALRHSVAYRMMNHEDGNTLYDVRNRLRHRSITTTEQIYDHFLIV